VDQYLVQKSLITIFSTKLAEEPVLGYRTKRHIAIKMKVLALRGLRP
jgi:hypothetical protein